MATRKRDSGEDPNAALEATVQACRDGSPAPVMLFVGEPSATRIAALAVIDALVPEERRSFNLETYDGRATSLAPILASLRTPPFLPGTKVIWVRESPLFLSGAKKGDVAKSMLTAWRAGRQKDAAEKLATLVALAGWSADKLIGTDWADVSKSAYRDVFGDEVGVDDAATVQAIHQALVARDLKLVEFRDESETLLDTLGEAASTDCVLLFTATAVDGRKRLVKRIQEIGSFVEFKVERERSGALSRDSITAIATQTCAARGKKLQRGAVEEIARRAGNDVAAFTNELEKLCLFVGDRGSISDADVRAVFLDMAESWIFDFTGGLAARNAAQTIPVLRGLMRQGEPALRILAMVAREIRLLLLARECLDRALASYWRPNLSYGAFQTRVLPHIDEATRNAFGKSHPFALYRRFGDAARVSAERLRGALREAAELDVRFKTSGGDAALLLEAFVVRWCR